METPLSDEIERLIKDLKDDRRDIRSRAAYELGKHHDARIVTPLTAALSDNDKFVRSWAADALGKIGPEAIAPLLSVMDGADPAVGYYAALALGALGDLRAVPMLAQAIQNGDWDIRSSAASALCNMGDAGTLPERVLADTNLAPIQRVRILDSLRDVAHTDEEVRIHYAIPDITEFCAARLQSEDERIRAGAAETLESIQSAAPADTVSIPSVPTEALPPPARSSAPNAPEPDTKASEPGKPKRSLWSRLLGREDGGR